jgi:hypothetical protein
MAELNLSSISGLQNLPAGTVMDLRLVPYGATSSAGTWYVFNQTGNDLVVNGSVQAGGMAPMGVVPNGTPPRLAQQAGGPRPGASASPSTPPRLAQQAGGPGGAGLEFPLALPGTLPPARGFLASKNIPITPPPGSLRLAGQVSVPGLTGLSTANAHSNRTKFDLAFDPVVFTDELAMPWASVTGQNRQGAKG